MAVVVLSLTQQRDSDAKTLVAGRIIQPSGAGYHIITGAEFPVWESSTVAAFPPDVLPEPHTNQIPCSPATCSDRFFETDRIKQYGSIKRFP